MSSSNKSNNNKSNNITKSISTISKKPINPTTPLQHLPPKPTEDKDNSVHLRNHNPTKLKFHQLFNINPRTIILYSQNNKWSSQQEKTSSIDISPSKKYNFKDQYNKQLMSRW